MSHLKELEKTFLEHKRLEDIKKGFYENINYIKKPYLPFVSKKSIRDVLIVFGVGDVDIQSWSRRS